MSRVQRSTPAELAGWPDPARLALLPDPVLAQAASILAGAVGALRGTRATAVALGEMAAVSERTVRRILAGHVWPDLETLVRLLATHGLPLGGGGAASPPVVQRERRTFTACRPCRAALADEFPSVADEMHATTGRDRAIELMRSLPPVPVLVALRYVHDTDLNDAPDELGETFRGDPWFVEIRHHPTGVFSVDCDLTQYAFAQFNLSDLSWMERWKDRADWPADDRWAFRDLDPEDWTDGMREYLATRETAVSLYPDDEW